MASQWTGLEGWLRYAALPTHLQATQKKFSGIFLLGNSGTSPIAVAGQELQDGLYTMFGQRTSVKPLPKETTSSALIVGTVEAFAAAGRDTAEIPNLKEDGYWFSSTGDNVLILGQNDRGALYGTYDYLARLAQGNFSPAAFASNPSAPIRYTNQWDNLDGSIERGYGGPSIFFRDGKVISDLKRVRQYARLLASVHLNGCIVNNVNSSHNLLSEENLQGLGRIADAMRPYGVRMGISLFFDTPHTLGGLPTSDPLDPAVIAWWGDITSKIYQHVPDMLGYTIKANSEGQPGPLTYGRTLADGANLFARALKPHGDGVVMYRAFVYNHHLDESDLKNDRANAAVEYFADLDAEFDDNVIIQIKFGPIDFQIREPPSPLLARLRKTPIMIEFMVAQEYLGQQSHYVYMAPEWKTILDFDLRIGDESSLVRNVVSGEHHGWKRAGYAAVVNTGSDPTWLGNHLSMSNLYAYGRLCWNPSEDSERLLQDWTRLTFGLNEQVVDTITKIGMETWPTYENYTGNLGIQTLCDILYTHYGPSPASQDGNGWGQWTRADGKAIGMDRTVATGTGNAGQYPPQVAARFEHIESTPDDLLLWFHHVPYTHRLKSGKTVIQHFYDAHYEGAANAQTFPERWATLKGLVDDGRFEHVAFRLNYQAGHSIVWRDSVNNFYRTKSGIEDEADRVGNHPWRIEAESMELSGYDVVPVVPAEAASGGHAIVAASADAPGTAVATLNFPDGVYRVAVNYFDLMGGRSEYEIYVNDTLVGKWKGDLEDHLGHDFSEFIDGHSATRISFCDVQIHSGDTLKIVGRPDGNELAPIDYVSVLPAGVVD